MATVPIYQANQVREQALQGGFQQEIDVTKNARALAVGLGNAGQMLDRVAIRDAEAASSKADTEIAAGWLQWDAANRGKFQGEKAGEYTAAAQEWWTKASQTYGATLDPMAKGLVGQSLNRRQAASLGQVAQFVEVEKEKHADNTYAANVDTTVQFGVTSGDVAGAAARVRSLAALKGARKGYTTEQTQAETLKNLSQLHIAQIAKLTELPGGAAVADAYYQANKAEVGFAQQPKIEQVIKAEVDNQFATQFAAQQADKPLNQQLTAAAAITDPAKREKALTQIKNNYSLVKEAQREVESKFADQAWQLVGQGKRVPEAILSSMDGKERVQLQEHLRAKAERGPVAPKTDPADHARLVDMMLNDPEAFKKERIVAAKLSPSDLEQFAAKQQAVRSASPKQDSMLTDEARVSGALVGAGIDAKKKPELAYQVRTEIDRRVRAESAALGGKDLSADQKQRVIDSVLMDKVYVNEWGSDPQKPLSTVSADQLPKAYVRVNGEDVLISTVPATDRALITASLRRGGQTPSEQSIVEVYLRNQAANAAKAPKAAPKPAMPAVPAAPTARTSAVPAIPVGQPGIYASAEEWAQYRAAQANK